MDLPVNIIDSYSGYPTISKNETIYFHNERENSIGETDIYLARFENDRYIVENLGTPVNCPLSDLDPILGVAALPGVSPDGKYIFFAKGDYDDSKSFDIY